MRHVLLNAALALAFVLAWTNRWTPIELDSSRPETIQVELKGNAANPGVYTLPWNATVEDLLAESGGLTEAADDSALNQTRILQDRDVITIPEKQETERISINMASAEELAQLPGIGPALAQRIVDYRQEHPFAAVEEIMEVKGIGEKLFAKMEPYLCL